MGDGAAAYSQLGYAGSTACPSLRRWPPSWARAWSRCSIGPSGMPHTVEERLKNAGELIGKLTAYGIAPENIYIDALAETCSIDTAAPAVTLGTISAIKQEFPEVKTICGLSNVSFGLPRRKYINAAFLSMAVCCGWTRRLWT